MTEEISAEVIKKTQKVLGKYVKKPLLTDKLLKKPPFRFLHDVISTIIKETGFLRGLFSDVEMVSENVKDKDAKVAFLNKLIEAVKTLSQFNLPVKASKIVAGLEPTNTNLLLQAIANSLDSKVDSTQYVSSIKSENKIKKTSLKSEKSKGTSKTHKEDKGSDKTTVKSTEKKLDTPKRNRTMNSFRKEEDNNKGKQKKGYKQEEKLSKEQSNNKESPKTDSMKKDNKKEKVKDESARKESHKIKESARKENTEHDSARNDNIKQSTKNENDSSSRRNSIKIEPSEITKIADGTSKKDLISQTEENLKDEEHFETHKLNEENTNKNLIRPKSARSKSGDMDKFKNVPKKVTDKPDEGPKVLELADLAVSKPHLPSRPKSSLRPPSVRPSSARPGAPRLRPDSAFPMQEAVPMGTINVIVENVDTLAADEEETVVIETAPAEPEPVAEPLKVELDNKGHLVEQILEQIEGEAGGNRRKAEIDWENIAVRNKEGATKDMTQLAGQIQNLTKTANPLGKLINFLHEDIEAMHGEIQLWINTKKQLYAEIRKQKKSSMESNKPLLSHLEQLNQETKKIQLEITNIHCNILKNDARIKDLLCK